MPWPWLPVVDLLVLPLPICLVLPFIVTKIYQKKMEIVIIGEQCSKLRVHPAPCVHILAAGCMDFKPCAPGMCMYIFQSMNTYI